jgi:hypothetical protein
MNNLHGLGKVIMNQQHNMRGIFLPAGDLLASHEGVIVLCIENRPEVILFHTCSYPEWKAFVCFVSSSSHTEVCSGTKVRFWTITRLRLKCDGTCAETRILLSVQWTSSFKSAGVSVQSTTGSRGVHISGSNGSNAGYITFQGSVKGAAPFASFPFTSPPVRHCVPSCFNWTLPQFPAWFTATTVLHILWLQIEEGGNFRLRRVAASILDNLPQIADGCLSSLGCCRGLVTPLHMRQHVMKCSIQILQNVLSTGKWKWGF